MVHRPFDQFPAHAAEIGITERSSRNVSECRMLGCTFWKNGCRKKLNIIEDVQEIYLRALDSLQDTEQLSSVFTHSAPVIDCKDEQGNAQA